jgi:BirA family biotin operon repressor/biotin-[acetyl-CoA-carboxylase] ligase
MWCVLLQSTRMPLRVLPMIKTASIRAALPPALAALPIIQLASTDSTNLEAKRRLEGDTRVPFLVLADTQTAGVGQRGHHFSSPADSGLYMSLVIPQPRALQLLMPAAGVASVQAVATLGIPGLQLKWVNDLMRDRAKIGGILCWLEQTPVPTAIIGIGLNIFPNAQRTALASDQPTGTLYPRQPESDPRGRLAGLISAKLIELMQSPELIMPAYREVASYVGQAVRLVNGEQDVVGILQGFADDGSVIIQTATGSVTAGSGSIRPQL